ncbi:NAD(P)-binding protein [Microbacterium ulmi]|uniref:NAD(P)-binding protein n=1 Tax=Microbacterium ulmi TaxID=179095 RepID=A0A7Y2LZR9_9MICO|nr:NAD(P)-binding protein [Microbacterium ulmi]
MEVVGGGVAGLVVARRLALAGADVVLHEASDRLGGTVARHVVGGIPLDAGAESFAVRGGSVAALLAELGLAGDIVDPRPGPAWLQPAEGSPVPLPATALLGIPADPVAADVVAVVGEAAAMRAAELDAMPLGDVPATLGALVRERHGADVLDRLVTPVVRGVHSIHPDDVPIERAHPALRAALVEHGSLSAAVRSLRAAAPPGSAVAGLRGGMHRLPAALAEDAARAGVDIRLGSRVDAFDAAMVVAARSVTAPAGEGRRIHLVTLVVDQDELDAAPRGSGLLVAEGAPGIRARALTHATAKWEWLRESAAGRHVLRLSYDDVPADPVETARTDAAALLGVALPRERVLDAARVSWTRPAPASPAPWAVVVGETVAGSGLAGIVAHAERTAQGLLARVIPG